MTPIIFFVAGFHLLVGYAYFLVTSRNLTSQSYTERLFETRRKLCAKHGFDMEKYLEMETHIRCPLGGDCSQAAINTIFGEIDRRIRDGQGKEVGHGELLDTLLMSGLKHTEAETLMRKMVETSLVLLVRGKTYINHEKVVDLIRSALLFALTPENDPRKAEFKQLHTKMQKIDRLAHKHAKRVLCFGFVYFMFQFVLFFRLTFWELSWYFIELFAFSVARLQLIVCYGYFLHTSTNLTIADFMRRLFLARRRKLCANHSFDMDRYLKLQKHSRCPTESGY